MVTWISWSIIEVQSREFDMSWHNCIPNLLNERASFGSYRLWAFLRHRLNYHLLYLFKGYRKSRVVSGLLRLRLINNVTTWPLPLVLIPIYTFQVVLIFQLGPYKVARLPTFQAMGHLFLSLLGSLIILEFPKLLQMVKDVVHLFSFWGGTKFISYIFLPLWFTVMGMRPSQALLTPGRSSISLLSAH